MSDYFSYLQHPMMSCLRLIPNIFSGIDKVLTFYYDLESGNVVSHFISREDNYVQVMPLDLAEIKKITDDLRKISKNPTWYAHDELEFEVRTEKGKQISLMQEDKRKILKLCFENKEDKKSDLLYIYFNSLQNILPVLSDKKKLVTSDKSIIQHLIYKMLTAFLDNENKNKLTFEKISQSAQNIIKETDNLKKKLNNSNERYGNSLINLCKMYLKKIEDQDKSRRKFEFGEDCIAKIKEYKGRLEDLEMIVNNAALYVSNIYYNTKDEIIMIHDYNIHFEKVQEKLTEELQKTGFDEYDTKKYYKQITLLNKYEEAAKLLLSEGRKITITSVGEKCKPYNVTGAAVSDSISKNIDEFNILFSKYADYWPQVKKHLKPLSNKIINIKIFQSKQA